MRTLYGGFISIGDIDRSNLASIASELKIVSGLHIWKSKIKDSLNTLAEKDKELFKTKSEKFVKAVQDIKIIENLLNPFKINQTFSQFQKNLLILIHKLKIPENILIKSRGSEEINIKSMNVFLETIDEVFTLLEKESDPGKKFSLSFFIDQLKTFSRAARYNVKEKSDFGVQVTTFDEIRGLNFDYLFIGGLCDGDFPTKYSPEVFLTKTLFLKKELNHLNEQRYRFYQVLSVWNEKLYLSYPKTGGKKELVESTFLKDFRELFTTKNQVISESVKLYSKDDILQYIGRNLKTGNSSEVKNLIKHHNISIESIRNSASIEENRVNKLRERREYNGYIIQEFDQNKTGQIKQQLGNLVKKEFSISQLEVYAKCPFKYFGERLLDLESVEEPNEEIEAIELGNLLHKIFYLFYSKIKDLDIDIQNADQQTFIKIKRILFRIAEEQLSETVFSSPIAFLQREKVLGLNGKIEDSILTKFLNFERYSVKNKPSFFELNFGTTFSPTHNVKKGESTSFSWNDIKLRGIIDRIDVNKNKNSFDVIDYKLSKTIPRKSDLERGTSLQLPIYLGAAQQIFIAESDTNLQPESMNIYSLKYSKRDFGLHPIKFSQVNKKEENHDKLSDIEEVISNSKELVSKYIEDISKGIFPLSPWEDRDQLVCKYCNLSHICRVNEIFPVK